MCKRERERKEDSLDVCVSERDRQKAHHLKKQIESHSSLVMQEWMSARGREKEPDNDVRERNSLRDSLGEKTKKMCVRKRGRRGKIVWMCVCVCVCVNV